MKHTILRQSLYALLFIVSAAAGAQAEQPPDLPALEKSAGQGDVSAQAKLGEIFEYGIHTPKNWTQAVFWFQKAAQQGDVRSQRELGWSYEYGKGVPPDSAQAMEWLRKASDQGDAPAMESIAEIYERSCDKGVAQDCPQALQWYEKSADHGADYAQNKIGDMYLHGKGMPKDIAKAMSWYRKASDHSPLIDRSLNFGLMYQYGKEVPQDYAEAMYWYRKVQHWGNWSAGVRIALLYRDGKGVPKDEAWAANLLRGAASFGHPDAQFFLDQLRLKRKGGTAWDAPENVAQVRKAAAAGDAGAQVTLGRMYQYGEGVEWNEPQARTWFQKAADQGNANGKYHLGALYYSGEGVPWNRDYGLGLMRAAAAQGDTEARFTLSYMNAAYNLLTKVNTNTPEARDLCQKAAEQGDVSGANCLGWMYRNGHGGPPDEALAIHWYGVAAAEAYPGAARNLGDMYEDRCSKGKQQDCLDAIRWYSQSAGWDEQESDEPQLTLGKIYLSGKGVPQDFAEAMKWFRGIAEKGDSEGQYYLGLMYYYGKGVPQDYAQALDWFRKAAANGSDPLEAAQRAVGVMYALGQGVPKNTNEGVRWVEMAAHNNGGLLGNIPENEPDREMLEDGAAGTLKIDPANPLLVCDSGGFGLPPCPPFEHNRQIYNENTQIYCNLILILTGTTGKFLAWLLIGAGCVAWLLRKMTWRKSFRLIAYCVAAILLSVGISYCISGMNIGMIPGFALAAIIVLSILGIFALVIRRIPWIALVVPVSIGLLYVFISVAVANGAERTCMS